MRPGPSTEARSLQPPPSAKHTRTTRQHAEAPKTGHGSHNSFRQERHDPGSRGQSRSPPRQLRHFRDSIDVHPFRPGYESGGPETASGERYDAEAWTAAIKTGLRGQFGGVRYGRNYRTAYALVEGAGKRVVVKINDVGPLMPGRIVDFNERTMRHFDPTLELGLIHHVSVTPLPGDNWQPGPVTGSQMVKYCTPLGRRFATTSEISDLLRTLSDRPLEVECGATVDWEPRLFRLMIRGSA